MHNQEIIQTLEEIATLMELLGENPFKLNAYRKGARQLENLSEDLGTLIEEGKLHTIQGIGQALEENITMLYRTGSLPLYSDLQEQVPKGLIAMLKIPGLGAKKISKAYRELNIDSIAKLKQACQEGNLSKLSGFGKKTEEKILDGIEHLEEYSKRRLWWEGYAMASALVDELQKLPEVENAEFAGSLRRCKETIGDIDLLASSTSPAPIMEWFTSLPLVATVTAQGSTKSSIRTLDGLQIDLRVVPAEQYPFALLYFTGSKEHNIKMRSLAKKMDWSLNEYALEGCNQTIRNESDIYQLFNIDYIPPELREDTGEVEAAKNKSLPKLLEANDIKGAFHNHTTASDGRSTLDEMAKAAEDLDWEYLGIADHSKSSVQANGLSEERLHAQIEEIQNLNSAQTYRVHLFSGTECDILGDGSLDFDNDLLKLLDYVVVSVHRGFQLDEKSMTERIIKALENPYTSMLGHLTGRLLLKREPYAVNVEKVIDAAIANGKIIELNANPFRLDMDWRFWHRAKEKGLMCAINPDAHATEQLQFYAAGVNIARKGWLEKEDVLNTYPLPEVKQFLATRSFVKSSTSDC